MPVLHQRTTRWLEGDNIIDFEPAQDHPHLGASVSSNCLQLCHTHSMALVSDRRVGWSLGLAPAREWACSISHSARAVSWPSDFPLALD